MKELKQEQPTFEHPQPQSNQPAADQIAGVDSAQDQVIAVLSSQVAQIQNTRINLNTDIIGLFETVSAVPTGTPSGPYQQIKIYVNGATLRFYWYDATGQLWHYVTATA